MRHVSSLLVAILVTLLLSSAPAVADTSTQQIAVELQSTSVYVDPSIEGAAAIRAKLSSRLREKDGLKLAVLAGDTVPSASSIAREIAAILGTPDTFAVTFAQSGAVAAMSDWPSQVVADDKMDRSITVTQNSIDRTLKFVDVIHEWQDANPKPSPPVPEAPPADYSTAYAGIGGAIGLLAVSALGLWLFKRRQKGIARVYGAPRKYRKELAQITSYAEKYQTSRVSLASHLDQLCRDASYLFRTRAESGDRNLIQHHLANAVRVMETYDKVHDNPRYYRDRGELLLEGEDSIASLSQFVLDVAQGDNSKTINEYKVNVHIVDDARNSMII